MATPMTSSRDTALARSAQPLILVLSAVRLLRDAIGRALDSEGFMMVRFGSPHSLPDAWDDATPDVVLADAGSPRMLERMGQLSARFPQVRIIAFGIDDELGDVLSYAEAGAAGYLVRESGATELRLAIESVIRDELICSPRVAAALLRRVADGAGTAPSPTGTLPTTDATSTPLTSRERQVLALVDRGMSNKEIGAALHISVATVKHHVHHILEKLQVRRRWAAAAQLHARAAASPPLAPRQTS